MSNKKAKKKSANTWIMILLEPMSKKEERSNLRTSRDKLNKSLKANSTHKAYRQDISSNNRSNRHHHMLRSEILR